MKVKWSAIALWIISISMIQGVYAAGLSNQPVSQQVYQSADGAKPSDTKVKQSLTQSQNSQSPQQPLANGEKSNSLISSDQQSSHILEAELTQINQNNLLYQQKADQRLLTLQSTQEILRKQIQQLDQAMMLLNQQVAQMNSSNTDANTHVVKSPLANAQQSISSRLSYWEHKIGVVSFFIIISMIVLTSCLALWMVVLHRRLVKVAEKKQKMPEQMDDDTTDEYDYLGSSESIPTKLNLAQAYIAMEDFVAAEKVIREVLQKGNDSQQKEAEALLDRIAAQSIEK